MAKKPVKGNDTHKPAVSNHAPPLAPVSTTVSGAKPAELTAQHVAAIHALSMRGVSIATILSWIDQYGMPLFLQALALFGNGGMMNLTVQQLVTFIAAALAALKAGTPVPTLPTPAAHA